MNEDFEFERTCENCVHTDSSVCGICIDMDEHVHELDVRGDCRLCVHQDKDLDDYPCKKCWWINDGTLGFTDMWEQLDDDEEMLEFEEDDCPRCSACAYFFTPVGEGKCKNCIAFGGDENNWKNGININKSAYMRF